MKINLAENMLRFGVKNLNETASQKVKTLAEQETSKGQMYNTDPNRTGDLAGAKKGQYFDATGKERPAADLNNVLLDRDRVGRMLWPVLTSIVKVESINTPNQFLKYSWRYPQYTQDNLEWHFKQTEKNDKEAFNKTFADKLAAAKNDANWQKRVIDKINKNLGSPQAIMAAQQAIINENPNSKFVQNNGHGGKFVDGTFHYYSLIAFLECKQAGMRDPSFMLHSQSLEISKMYGLFG